MKTYSKFTAILTLTLLLVSLLPIIWLGTYNHPTGDDYYYGVETYHAWKETHSLFTVFAEAAKGVSEQYQSWQGTYSAMFLMYLPPNIFGARAYRLVTPVILAMLIGGIFFLSHELLCPFLHATVTEWLAIASVMSFLCVQTVPFAPESFFWYNGSMYYTGYLAVTLLYFGVFCQILRNPSRFKSVLACLFAFFLAGGNYVSLLPAMLLSFSLTALFLFQKKPGAKYLLPPCLAFCVGFLISAMAPGNSVRQSGMWKISAVKAILKSLRQGLIFLRGFSSLWIVLFLLLLTPVIWNLCARSRFSFRFPLPVIAFAYGLLCSTACPTFYTMNSTGPARAAAVMYYAFLFFLLFSYCYLLGFLQRMATEKKGTLLRISDILFTKYLPAFGAAAVLLALLCIPLGKASSLVGIRALTCIGSGSATSYEAEYQERLRILSDDGIPDATLSPYQTKADLLYVGDFSSDPEDPTNRRVAQYFGKRSVVVTEN